jgi:hypothetical protein
MVRVILITRDRGVLFDKWMIPSRRSNSRGNMRF